MDEILVNNFMVFHDVVEAEHYDLVIGDEAWDVDYFLHENPELKRFAFAWMTDFVGWLPMPDGGAARGRAHRRLQRRDDRAARPVPAPARPVDLRRRPRRHRPRHVRPRPARRSASGPRANFDFAGYVTGFDPAAFGDRAELRAELGYRPDERVCVVTVGGSGVGGAAAAARRRRGPAVRRAVRRACSSSSWPARASTRSRCPRATASTSAASCPTCTGTSPRATWRWSRAGSPPAWS